jgi:hypothetical protein
VVREEPSATRNADPFAERFEPIACSDGVPSPASEVRRMNVSDAKKGAIARGALDRAARPRREYARGLDAHVRTLTILQAAGRVPSQR